MKKLIIKILIFLGAYLALQIAVMEVLISKKYLSRKEYGQIGEKQPNTIFNLQSGKHDLSQEPMGNGTITIDKYGFTNKQFCANPKVLLIGDSFFIQSYVKDEQTSASILNEKYGNCTSYNIAGVSRSNLSVYNYLVGNNIIEQPEMVVIEIIERNLHQWLKIDTNRVYSPTDEYLNYITKFRWNLLPQALSNKPRFKSTKKVIRGTEVYFLRNKLKKLPRHDIDSISINLQLVKEYLNKKGVEVYYMIVPDKESVFYEEFDESYTLIPRFEKVLQEKNIPYISVFNDFRKNPKDYYFTGNSHWNEKGIFVATEKIDSVYSTLKTQ